MYRGIQDVYSCDMVNNKWELFFEFVFMCLFILVWMRMRMRVFEMVAVIAVEHENTSQNINKVVDKKGETRMNRVVHIVVVVIMDDK